MDKIFRGKDDFWVNEFAGKNVIRYFCAYNQAYKVK